MDIRADLRKYAGPIVAKRITAEPPKRGKSRAVPVSMLEQTPTPTLAPAPKRVKSRDTPGLAPERVPTPTPERVPTLELTIEDIAAMVKLPLVPLKDSRGYIHDSGTLAITCERGHIHRYYLSDIARGITCVTCSAGTKHAKMARVAAEKIFGVPFCLVDSDRTCTRWANPALPLTIECIRARGSDAHSIADGKVILKLYTTVSEKRITASVSDTAITCIDMFPCVRANVLAYNEGRSRVLVQSPLAFTPALAALAPGSAEYIIDDDKLHLENC